MNNYKVTITIESNEECVTEEFYVEANSFEEAYNSVRAELNLI